jgi:predicted ArsR family transcriptional regulator
MAMNQSIPANSSDVAILDLLRKLGPMTVTALATATDVTATAVRQRLHRLMGQQMIQRELVRAGRGRPGHRYRLTDKGQRQTGANFADLSIALWQEIRGIQDPEVRRGLLQRLAKRMAAMYADRIHGRTAAERMQSLSELFADRNVPFSVDTSGLLPVLTAEACPYPEVANQDRGICALEKMMFAELLGENVKLADCRLDGATCCTFQLN